MRPFLIFIALCTLASPAAAQDAATLDKLNRLERDVRFLQRQIYRGASADPRPVAGATGGGSAALSVEVGQLHEQIRHLRGQLEQVQYENNQLKQQQKLLSEDMEFRIRELEDKLRAQAPLPGDDIVGEKQTPEENAEALAEETSNDADAPAKAVSAAAQDSDSHYNQAFELLNQKAYAKAAASFTTFLRRYPNDPLVPNAYYWLGESYYARGDYVRAADGFRRGYEADKEGQKAPDNLLKLGLSLASVKRKDEACVILGQLLSNYKGKHHASLREKASQTVSRLKCE